MSGDFTPPNDAVLYTEKLVKTYNQRNVVKGVSIHVNKGEIVGLLGPNGAGKTTTFYMIVGIIRPNSGRVVFQGRDITNDPMCDRAQHGIAYLAQEPSVFRRMTSFENIMAIMETLPMKRDEMKKSRKFFGVGHYSPKGMQGTADPL